MSELRRDPITGRWVILAPEQTRRPRDFTPAPAIVSDASLCPFCEGHEAIAGHEILAWRPNGSAPDGPGWALRVVANREPVLRVEARQQLPGESVFQAVEGLGAHEVIIETPRHDETLSTMAADRVARVVWAWRERMRDLKRDIRLKSFAIIKNHGALAGATLDHAHSQLFAMPVVPLELERELQGAALYHTRTGGCVYCDIVEYEQDTDRRLISGDEHIAAVAPFAPRVPFETWIIPRAHAAGFEQAPDAVLDALAARLQDVLRRLDAALQRPPFNLVLHTAPVGEETSASFHWHVEVIPRLARFSGLQWGTGLHVNQVPPEEAAQVMRDVV